MGDQDDNDGMDNLLDLDKKKRFYNKFDTRDGVKLSWVQCSHLQCRRWHREKADLNYGAVGVAFTCPKACNQADQKCRENYTADEGESENEYWETHPDDKIESTVRTDSEEKDRQKIVDTKTTIEKWDAFFALDENERRKPEKFVELMFSIKKGPLTCHHAHMCNTFFSICKGLKDDEGVALLLSNKVHLFKHSSISST
jgi:hypothetical protein